MHRFPAAVMSRCVIRCASTASGARGPVASGSPPALGPVAEYNRRVSRHMIARDEKQIVVAEALQRLYVQLKHFTPPDIDTLDHVVVLQSQSERRARAAARAEAAAAAATAIRENVHEHDDTDHASAGITEHGNAEAQDANEAAAVATAAVAAAGPPPAGVYIWGPVGCGKTYIMDMFFDLAVVPGGKKQRLHFHSFMRDVLQSYHRLYTQASIEHKESYDFNLLRPLAKAIAKQSTLLCFDEMQVPDIATAAIMHRLFDQLRQYGVVIVATSNRSPTELYSGHFSESYFVPWVKMMSENWEIVEVPSSVDYRRGMLSDIAAADDMWDPSDPFSDSYFSPLDADAVKRMDECWRYHCGGDASVGRTLSVLGRSVSVPRCTAGGVCRFDFAELCAVPLGPADYLAIASAFHTVLVDNIPAFSMQMRDQARRFISLVDALYECNTRLLCSASRVPDDMFVDVSDDDASRYDTMHREMMGEMYDEMDYAGKVFENRLFTGEEELFASQRCVSRLCEIRGVLYRTATHRPGLGLAGLDPSQLEYGTVASFSNDQETTVGLEHSSAPGVGKKERPRFGQKHFFGSGWWERVVGRGGARNKSRT